MSDKLLQEIAKSVRMLLRHQLTVREGAGVPKREMMKQILKLDSAMGVKPNGRVQIKADYELPETRSEEVRETVIPIPREGLYTPKIPEPEKPKPEPVKPKGEELPPLPSHVSPNIPRSAKEARVIGSKTFYSKPCTKGHSSIRYTTTSACAECARLFANAHYHKNKKLKS